MYQVSLDYLAGLSDDKQGLSKSLLSDDETKLIHGFRKLDAVGQGRLFERMEVLLHQMMDS